MLRYTPSRHYLTVGLAGVALAACSGWLALQWAPAAIASVLFVLASAILIVFALQPPVEVAEAALIIGRRQVPWTEIQRLDQIWISPLILQITLTGQRRVLLIYPGDFDSGKSLLRHIRRCAREAVIDGRPYDEVWPEHSQVQSERKSPAAAGATAVAAQQTAPAPRYRLLMAEDEEEVERMFQRLKTVGHLDPKNSSEEK